MAILTLVFSSVILDGSDNGINRELKKQIDQAGDALNKIERHMAEWGHASISGFVLMPDKGTNRFFDLRYDQATSNYVAAIRTNIQGQAAFLEQTDFAVGVAARAANALQGLNVQGPAPALREDQLATVHRQNEINQAVHRIQQAQLEQYYQSLTNSNSNTFNGLFNPYGDKGAPAAPSNAPTGPTNLVPEMPKVTLALPDAAFTNKFAPIGKLVEGLSSAQISENAILKLAMTAKETERVLNFMSHPVNLGDDKQVFFAIGQISVMPGWRTRQDYICEVSARFSYSGTTNEILERIIAQPKVVQRFLKQRQRAGDVKITKEMIDSFDECPKVDGPTRETNRLAIETYSDTFRAQAQSALRSGSRSQKVHAYEEGFQALAKTLNLSPTKNMSVVSAFPFMESQVLDMHNSYRSQMTFLMNLAGTYLQAGYKIEFETLMRYIKQVQKDFATRTAFPTVVPGVDASVVTYRFDPEATAMTEPGDRKPKSGNILLPTSIPVLVLVIVEKDEWEIWPSISVDVETRWVPRKNKTIWRNIADGVTKNRVVDKRYSQKKDLELAAEWDFLQSCLEGKLEAVCCGANGGESEIGRELRRKLAFFQNVAWGRSTYLDLPEPEPEKALCCSTTNKNIEAEEFFPKDGFLNGRTTVAVRGKNFKSNGSPVSHALVGGRPAENLIVHSDTLITFEVPPWSDKTNKIDFLEKEVEVVLLSRCSFGTKTGLKFTNVAGKTPAAGGDDGKPKSLPDLMKEVKRTADQLKEAITDTNLSGVIKYQFQIGKPETSTNSPGASSTVINVQAGQNANAQK